MASGCRPASTENVVSCQRAPCRNQTRAPLLGQDLEEWVNIHRRSPRPLSTETVKGKTQTVYGQAQCFAGVTAGPRAFGQDLLESTVALCSRDPRLPILALTTVLWLSGSTPRPSSGSPGLPPAVRCP